MNAIFPGSFDPVTCGHIDLIKRASKIFSELTVLVMTNTNKHGIFSPAERVALLNDSVACFDNVKVLSLEADLTVRAAESLGAKVIVRGARNGQDFETERGIADMNRHLDPSLETVLLPAVGKYSFISSTLVKEVARFDGNLAGLVPQKVARALKEKMC
ncbi:pantetheine-phosphate adenylyltransferase [Liquorilactobacillus uvarum]|uniref:Phosphopantetheine adenylyltransferase n=1 Tax=Liquorilactobacillus uvarum DSM 19971 TaxID=1423812 RepID=A0A0R1QCZ2_9LACO|nr:pantetheine-phosphate adenylyltransferase [Liquorilactobacillus uvarum]KRL38728.1 phosphopantetheine adenylyltransferase [Liquorilactobacillus uvarum DSM 19971]